MSKKLQLRWQGPFRVVKMMGARGRTYSVTDNRGLERPVNVLRMKPYLKTPHPVASEADYASHLQEAGEALITECNRGEVGEDEAAENSESVEESKEDISSDETEPDMLGGSPGTQTQTPSTCLMRPRPVQRVTGMKAHISPARRHEDRERLPQTMVT